MKLTLPISRRTGLIQILRERGAKFGVEVGTDHGEYAKQLCEGIPGLKLYCVDPYLAYTEGNDYHDQKEVDEIYMQARIRLAPYDAEILRKTSMEAVEDFSSNDHELDFVFIDGNHNYPYVLEDITEWTKKVKPGGIIAGHDYKDDPTRMYGVIGAVDKYVKDNNISPLFILEKGSFVPCWLFFKQ